MPHGILFPILTPFPHKTTHYHHPQPYFVIKSLFSSSSITDNIKTLTTFVKFKKDKIKNDQKYSLRYKVTNNAYNYLRLQLQLLPVSVLNIRYLNTFYCTSPIFLGIMIYPQMCNEAEKRQNTTTAAAINAATSLYPR